MSKQEKTIISRPLDDQIASNYPRFGRNKQKNHRNIGGDRIHKVTVKHNDQTLDGHVDISQADNLAAIDPQDILTKDINTQNSNIQSIDNISEYNHDLSNNDHIQQTKEKKTSNSLKAKLISLVNIIFMVQILRIFSHGLSSIKNRLFALFSITRINKIRSYKLFTKLSFDFSSMQIIGKSLMLPIAMLPIAGLLLRFGQADLLNISAISAAGNAIFANLPLIFALGISIGLAKDNDGAAALSGLIGYLILIAFLKEINQDIDCGVFGGILIGILASFFYNTYHNVQFPSFLAFFGGRRFVPIITGLSAIVVATIFSIIWPPIQTGVKNFSFWIVHIGETGMFLYGVLNRLLLAFGLHPILHGVFWFSLGDYTNAAGTIVHGDIPRFMAGDHTAGYFQSGFFPIMMFGLPAMCLAMYHQAFTQNKKVAGGILLSLALTACITGVTEPLEYSFLFISPLLYVVHAVLTGLSMMCMYILDVRAGFSFSAGLIDYVLFYKMSHNSIYIIPFGVAIGIVYYIVTTMFIRVFNLKTIGRTEAASYNSKFTQSDQSNQVSYHSSDNNSDDYNKNTTIYNPQQNNDDFDRFDQYIYALGGFDNIVDITACTTRLRLSVRDQSKIHEEKLKLLGAKGVLKIGATALQVIIGLDAEIVADAIKKRMATMQYNHPNSINSHNNLDYQSRIKTDEGNIQEHSLDANNHLNTAEYDATLANIMIYNKNSGYNAKMPFLEQIFDEEHQVNLLSKIIQALGGEANCYQMQYIALTRIRVEVVDDSLIDRNTLINECGIYHIFDIDPKIKLLYINAI